MAELLILGDSILWGQGLDEPSKCSTLLCKAWQSATQAEVNLHRYAHSGADIWDDGQSGILAAINPSPPPFPASFPITDEAILDSMGCADDAGRDLVGEIPNEEPYILRQILDAKDNLGDAPVDLVLVDGGINDTEVYNLVLPGKSLAAVVARGRSIQPRLTFVLTKIGAAFPSAKILVTGYYPVVSGQTRILELLQFAKRVATAALQEGVDIAGGLLSVLEHPFESILAAPETATVASLRLPDPLAPLVSDLANRCAAWTGAIHAAIRQSVATFDPEGTVAAFADPQFAPQHAVFAPESLLWRYTNGQPPDPMVALRKSWCEAKALDGFARLSVECASMGHPSPEGAKRYAETCIGAARALGVF
jgi:hypothetical protein